MAGAPRRPRLAITLGDPRGIGGEITSKAIREPEPIEADVTIIGPNAPESFGLEVHSIGRWIPGSGAAAAGHLSVAAIEHAVALAVDGAVDALVTAPITEPPVPPITRRVRNLQL